MDPSEFEGTVEKKGNALSAGVFEVFLQDTHQKEFTPLDLSKECGDIHLAAYNLKESAALWSSINLASMQGKWVDIAIKVTEYREEFIARKRELSKELKAFNIILTSINSTAAISPEAVGTLREEINRIISKFKTEFDFVANNAYKYSECAFLDVYKSLREAPDPSVVIEENFKACSHVQEVLKVAQEQLTIAAAKIEHAAVDSSVGLHQQIEEMQERSDSEKNELLQKHQAEMADLRSRFDLELRTRENQLKNNLERQHFDLQQQCESSLAAKDAEIASVLGSLNDANHRILEAEEREKTLEVEVQKRRDIEEKIRVCLTDLADERNLSRDLQSKLDATSSKLQIIDAQLEKNAKESKSKLEQLIAETTESKQKLKHLESELEARPALDLSNLRMTLNLDPVVETDVSTVGTRSAAAHGPMPWPKLEAQIINSIRQSNAAAVNARVKEQEARDRMDEMSDEFNSLKSRLKDQEAVVASLERDLLMAHSSVESSAALLKVYHPQPLPSPTERSKTGRGFGKVTSPSPLVVGETDSLSLDKIIPSVFPAEGSVDLEVGSGGKGTAAVVMKGLDSSDRMIQAVQHQRDRYMKIAKDKESELDSLRSRMERLQDEQLKLRNENMELYRRLRLLRVNSRGGGGIGGTGVVDSASSDFIDLDDGGEDGRTSKIRRRGSDGSMDATAPSNAIDSKYSKLYENQIDPFRMEELDRQAFISKLNVLERSMAFAMRMFLQDAWARKAFLVYVLMIHMFAIGYVFQVLNPQLIEEVDFYTRQKYSAETFNIDMDREHPDVRYR